MAPGPAGTVSARAGAGLAGGAAGGAGVREGVGRTSLGAVGGVQGREGGWGGTGGGGDACAGGTAGPGRGHRPRADPPARPTAARTPGCCRARGRAARTRRTGRSDAEGAAGPPEARRARRTRGTLVTRRARGARRARRTRVTRRARGLGPLRALPVVRALRGGLWRPNGGRPGGAGGQGGRVRPVGRDGSGSRRSIRFHGRGGSRGRPRRVARCPPGRPEGGRACRRLPARGGQGPGVRRGVRGRFPGRPRRVFPPGGRPAVRLPGPLGDAGLPGSGSGRGPLRRSGSSGLLGGPVGRRPLERLGLPGLLGLLSRLGLPGFPGFPGRPAVPGPRGLPGCRDSGTDTACVADANLSSSVSPGAGPPVPVSGDVSSYSRFHQSSSAGADRSPCLLMPLILDRSGRAKTGIAKNEDRPGRGGAYVGMARAVAKPGALLRPAGRSPPSHPHPHGKDARQTTSERHMTVVCCSSDVPTLAELPAVQGTM